MENEFVSVPRIALLTGLEYYLEKQLHYKELEMKEMAEWCEGKASVYKHILDTYAK